MVVLASAPGRLEEFDRFLSGRGWIVRLHSDLKKFLADISTIKPAYALISADYQHPNLASTRRLLWQVFRTQIIDFNEEQTTQAWEALKSATGVYQIYGQLSGPAFERALVVLTSRFESREVSPAEKTNTDRIRKGVLHVLQKNFRFAEGVISRPVQWASKIHCVHLKTSQLDGHFLIATGGDEELDAHGKTALEIDLKKMLNEIFGHVETYDIHPMKIRSVEFKSWAAKTADFTESGLHDGLEISIAFFTGSSKVFDLKESSHSDYYEIEIAEISPDLRNDFEIFIHLPLNGKFLMYVPRWGMMNAIQLSHLEGRGIKKLYVLKLDRQPLLRARTHHHFEQSVANFYETRTV